MFFFFFFLGFESDTVKEQRLGLGLKRGLAILEVVLSVAILVLGSIFTGAFP